MPLEVSKNGLRVPEIERSAQLIDGQHRVAGLKAAIDERAEVGSMSIPVTIYRGLTTSKCADLFLAINTEQKPAPRSLVFDLYGVADEKIIDRDAARARDIAMALHEESASPYYDLIKLPGTPRRKGGIALSTAVSAIKPLVEEKGDLEQVGISELETQKKVVFNFFSAVRSKYGEAWGENSNAFMFASGFAAGIDFLRKKMIPYCNSKKSFTE